MSTTWSKLKIKKQSNEYECYIRFKFDFQMQSIRIKAFLYLTDSEGNITLTEKKNKLGYDPRIVGNLTVERNFLKRKRRSGSNNKDLYFEVMKYQGNFNICNLPLIDDYFRNGKALIYQYEDLINLMSNKKYKIQISPKKFTIILDVLNYGNIYLNLFNKLEEVEKQELIFLEQNEEALCHRYCSSKAKGNQKNNKNAVDDIQIIEENKIFNMLGGRIFIGNEDKENTNIDENEGKLDDFLYENEKDYEENSDNSSIYDSFLFDGNDNDDKIKNDKKEFIFNEKDFNNNVNNTSNYKIFLNNNQNSSSQIIQKKFSNFNNNYTNIFNDNNNDLNNFFNKFKKDDNDNENMDPYQIENSETKSNSNSDKKELNFFEKAKNIVNKYNLQKENDNNIKNQELYSNSNTNSTSSIIFNNQTNNRLTDYSINNSFNLLCNRIISQKANESIIFNENEKKILLFSSGFDNTAYNLNLLYKSTLHGDDKLIFHNRCDNTKNLFLIILTLDNKKFGFFTSVGLSTDKKIVYDNNAFLFKLANEEIDCFHIKSNEICYYGFDDYVLYLGGEQLIIKDKFLSNASTCGVKMRNYRMNNNYQINNGNKNFIIKELEAYNIPEI